MSQAYKKTTPRLFWSISFALIFLWLCSCTTQTERKEAQLTSREMTFQKGLLLFNISKYAEAAPFFLKISQNALSPSDEIYNSSLWNLTVIYEKFGDYDKAVLALHELEERQPSAISLFKIQLSLMKNYTRLNNRKITSEIKSKIDASLPVNRYSLSEIYFSVAENTGFNFDLQMLQELQFLGEIQKYFVFVMESKDISVNARATELLIYLYDTFLKAIEKDSYNNEFRRAIAIELLSQLRKFDHYKLDRINLNMKTIAKFSVYSIEKQKYLTDWLHQ